LAAGNGRDGGAFLQHFAAGCSAKTGESLCARTIAKPARSILFGPEIWMCRWAISVTKAFSCGTAHYTGESMIVMDISKSAS